MVKTMAFCRHLGHLFDASQTPTPRKPVERSRALSRHSAMKLFASVEMCLHTWLRCRSGRRLGRLGRMAQLWFDATWGPGDIYGIREYASDDHMGKLLWR